MRRLAVPLLVGTALGILGWRLAGALAGLFCGALAAAAFGAAGVFARARLRARQGEPPQLEPGEKPLLHGPAQMQGAEGWLYLSSRRLILRGPASLELPLSEIEAFRPAPGGLEVEARGRGVLRLRLPQPGRWQEALRRALHAALLLLLGLGLAGTSCIRRQRLEEPKIRFTKHEPEPHPAGLSPAAKAQPKRPSTSEEWGEQFFKKGDYRRSVAYLREAVEKNPSSAKLWRNLGSAYAMVEDYENALLCYQRAIKRNPADIKTWYNLSIIHNFRGSEKDLKEAEEAALKGLAVEPGYAPLHASLGNIYADQGRDSEALQSYATALKLNPRDPITRFNKGALHYKRREIKAAEIEYREALRIDPKDAEAAQNLAAIYILQGRLKEAESLNRWVISQKPEDEDTLENAYFNLGIIYDRQNKLEQALNMYKLALQVAPWDAAAYVNAAVILERLNRKREALTYWEKYQRLFPASRRAKEIARRIEILRKLAGLKEASKTHKKGKSAD